MGSLVLSSKSFILIPPANPSLVDFFFQQPAHPLRKLIELPYHIQDERYIMGGRHDNYNEYDGGEFHDYPRRVGWWEVYQERKQCEQSHEEQNVFYQNWLVVGLLTELFRVPVQSILDAMVQKSHSGVFVLTTRDIGGLFERLCLRERALSDLARKKRHIARNHTINVVVQVSDGLTSPDWIQEHIPALAYNMRFLSDVVHNEGRKTLPSLSFLATGDFSHLLSDDSDPQGHIVYERSDSRYNELIHGGWCPHTVERIQMHMRHGVDLYACMIVPPRFSSLSSGKALSSMSQDEISDTQSKLRSKHAACYHERCNADEISEQEYQTLHLTEGCRCHHFLAPQQDLKDALESDRVALLKISSMGSATPCLSIVPLDKNRPEPFTAISHVWADGLGNPRQELPPFVPALETSPSLRVENQQHCIRLD